MQDATALTHFAIGAKICIDQVAARVDQRFGRREFRHYSPFINLRRSQPDRLSIIITISTISTM